jgi:hypothetical protein
MLSLDKSSRKMYTIFSAVLRQQRKSDVMTSFGHSARSAVYYQADSLFTSRNFTAVCASGEVHLFPWAQFPWSTGLPPILSDQRRACIGLWIPKSRSSTKHGFYAPHRRAPPTIYRKGPPLSNFVEWLITSNQASYYWTVTWRNMWGTPERAPTRLEADTNRSIRAWRNLRSDNLFMWPSAFTMRWFYSIDEKYHLVPTRTPKGPFDSTWPCAATYQ